MLLLLHRRGNKFWFWEALEALNKFLSYFIQSKPSMSTHEYYESNHVNKFVMLLNSFLEEYRTLSQFFGPDYQ